MTKTRPWLWHHSQACVIWPDGPFKEFTQRITLSHQNLCSPYPMRGWSKEPTKFTNFRFIRKIYVYISNLGLFNLPTKTFKNT